MTDEQKEGTGKGRSAASSLPIVENLFSLELYADEAHWFALKHGNVCITFATVKCDHANKGELSRVVVGRLTMPVHGAQKLALGLYNYLAQEGLAPKLNPSHAPAN
ncbi:MAG: hypothetical protein ACT4OF_14165 [Caulobacteraceae bacterium]